MFHSQSDGVNSIKCHSLLLAKKPKRRGPGVLRALRINTQICLFVLLCCDKNFLCLITTFLGDFFRQLPSQLNQSLPLRFVRYCCSMIRKYLPDMRRMWMSTTEQQNCKLHSLPCAHSSTIRPLRIQLTICVSQRRLQKPDVLRLYSSCFYFQLHETITNKRHAVSTQTAWTIQLQSRICLINPSRPPQKATLNPSLFASLRVKRWTCVAAVQSFLTTTFTTRIITELSSFSSQRSASCAKAASKLLGSIQYTWRSNRHPCTCSLTDIIVRSGMSMARRKILV